MTEKEILRELSEDEKADIEFEISKENFLMGKTPDKETDLEPLLDKAWEEKYFRELNEKHTKRLRPKNYG